MKTRELKAQISDVSLDSDGYPRMAMEASEPETLHYPENTQNNEVNGDDSAGIPKKRRISEKSQSSKMELTESDSKQDKHIPEAKMSKKKGERMQPSRPHSNVFGELFVTKATRQSYIQYKNSEGKKCLLVSITATMDSDHKRLIERCVDYATLNGITKDQLVQFRDSILED